ncbi:MAG: permease [Bacteroidota bacterium]
MQFIIDLLVKTLGQVWSTFAADWPFLVASALVAAALKVYMDQERVSAFLQRHRNEGVLIATGAAVTTPLCSCGTTAVILGMMAGSLPWAPIVAFMVSSPLTSPEELVFSAGLFGWTFAAAFFISSILLGLIGGGAAYLLESRGWLKGQARFKPISGGSGIEGTAPAAAAPVASPRWAQLGKESWIAGKRLALYFFGFAAIGYLLNNLIPSAWVANLFGEGHIYGVPLAATLGIPFYFNTEASMPLARALLDAGMSHGAVLAYLITGSGTSVGAIAGALTIARWRIVGLVLGTLLVGAIAFGYLYDLLSALGIL